jgi:hypothetical protein
MLNLKLKLPSESEEHLGAMPAEGEAMIRQTLNG